jgi:hypothetical protein
MGCITIEIRDIIHRPVFYLKHDILETGFCLQTELTQVGPVERAGLCLRIGPEYVQPEDGDRIQSQKSCFKQKAESWIMPRIVIVILIYYCHKPIYSINLLGS